MAAPANPDDESVLRALGDELAAAMTASIGPWVERSVREIADAWQPGLAEQLAAPAAEAAAAAADDVGARLRELLAADVDEQRTGPLAVVRAAVSYPTDVLRRAGVPAVVRDEFAERAFVEDRYGLAPAAFADLDEGLADLGLRWGAAKAHVVLRRRRGAPG